MVDPKPKVEKMTTSTHCPRCGGNLIRSYGESFCLQCSWNPSPSPLPIPNRPDSLTRLAYGPRIAAQKINRNLARLRK